jgi:hypothetical protein
MSAKVGDKAFNGEWEQIGAQYFDITEDMTMEFQGKSCNIADGAGSLVEKLGTEHGRQTTRRSWNHPDRGGGG